MKNIITQNVEVRIFDHLNHETYIYNAKINKKETKLCNKFKLIFTTQNCAF